MCYVCSHVWCTLRAASLFSFGFILLHFISVWLLHPKALGSEAAPGPAREKDAAEPHIGSGGLHHGQWRRAIHGIPLGGM
jgi:hypothetical protein